MKRRTLLAAWLALTADLPVSAQMTRVRRIGWLGTFAPTTPEMLAISAATTRALAESGYVEGQNLTIDRRYTGGEATLNAAFAAEFVDAKADLIIVTSSTAAQACKAATSSIPIVMAQVANPERSGLVATLARPGGNVTGISTVGAELGAKLMQTAQEALPGRSRLGLIWSPDNSGSAISFKETDVPAATALGMTVISLEVRTAGDVEPVLRKALREQAEILYPHLTIFGYLQPILDFAFKQNVAVLAASRLWAERGALMSFGPDQIDLFRRAGQYAARILDGANPADMPVEQPSKFHLCLNLKTAKALGLTIPPTLLARADEVIE